MKRTFLLRYGLLLATLVAGAVCAHSADPAQTNDRVIAIVNDDVITMSELLNEGGSDVQGDPNTVLKSGKTVKEAREIVLEQIIMKKLLDQVVKEYGLDVTDLDVDRAIAEQMKMRGISKSELIGILAKEGKSYESYREEVAYSIKKERVIAHKLSSHLIVTDDDIKKYFNEHKDEFAGRKEFRLSEIVLAIPTDATDSTVVEVRNKADMIHQKLKAGANFDAMAKEYSMTSDAEKGGDMGFIQPSTLDPGFVSLLNTMKVGEISDVIATPNGFLIFKITDAKPITSLTAEDVKPEIVSRIKQEKTMVFFERWMKELRDNAFVQKML
jgi:peptidyl-prolyl cis-trans isomerase SurA